MRQHGYRKHIIGERVLESPACGGRMLFMCSTLSHTIWNCGGCFGGGGVFKFLGFVAHDSVKQKERDLVMRLYSPFG